MNIPVLAEESLRRLGERTVLVFDGRRYTNARLLDYSRRLHRAFGRLGLAKGDFALMCMINAPLVYPVFGGIFRTGAAALPVMFVLTAPEIRFVLEDSMAQGVITDQMGLPRVREAVQGLDSVRWIVVRDGQDDLEARVPEYSLETLLLEEPEMVLPDIDEDDLALMMYTAGTTGRPKGVLLTHGNLYASADAAQEAAEHHLIGTPRITMSALPMAHIFGVGVMNSGYLIPENLADSYSVQMAWFEPEQFMSLIQEHRCNTMGAVPTMLIFILNHPKADQYDLSSIEEVVCGASPLPVEVARAFQEKYGCRVREIYGQTECVGLGSANRISWPYKPGSAGKAYYNTELKILDENDRELPVGGIGEIVLRGPAVMKGYHNRPEETAKTLRNGWLHTGDMGYLDEEGWLFIVDRKKDMIIRGGENIYPAQLEDILYQHEAVAEAAIVGAPDPVYGEKVVAYVVSRSQAGPSEQEIKDFFKGRTSSFKAPERVFFVEALPKSAVGKILRRELRDRATREA
ncbi:MAG: AMP-binding protein [Proteobacteria bacterium]|nr:AMP-binding protein [Pseudomonadota bacterium]